MRWGSVVIGYVMYLLGYWTGRIDGRNGWRWCQFRSDHSDGSGGDDA